jgi:hypothetical protein
VGLTAPESREQRTWSYVLQDRSRENIAALIANPRVEDTYHLDRANLRVELDRPGLQPWLRELAEADRLPYVSLLFGAVGLLGIWNSRYLIGAFAQRSLERLFRLAAVRTKPALFVLATVVFAAVFRTFLYNDAGGDMGMHLAYAEAMRSVSDITSPHFLFQLILRIVHISGLSYRLAATLVLGLCYAGMALLIAMEIERRGAQLTPFRAYILIPAVLLASHIFLLTLVPPRWYHGYFVPIAYHNPTQQLNKLFGLWIVFTCFAQFVDRDRATYRRSLVLSILCVLSALAKPSFLIAFLPAALLYAMYDLSRRRWEMVHWLTAMAVLPTIAVLLWQAGRTYDTSTDASVIYAPFAVFSLQSTLTKLPLSLAFPFVVAAAASWSGAWNVPLGFTWLFLIVGMAVTLLLGESGDRLMHGNFAWTGQTAVFLAYVESMLFVVTTRIDARWRRVAWAVFGVHVACGILWYGLAFSSKWHDYTGM